jgi:radical SAM superfamily enzyme YgiQ (UPF0313 family)
MSRICLVVPTNEFDHYFVQLPFDVACAAGQLRAEGHDVEVWDQRLQRTPTSNDPDVVVVFTAIAERAQCYPMDLALVRLAVERVREMFGERTTIAVGPHGNNLPEATREELGVHHVARGESDSAAVQAVRDVLAGAHGPVLPGARGDLLASEYPVIDFADMAPGAFDLLPLHGYTSEVIRDGLPEKGPCGMAFAARGCTYGCTFCHLPFGTRIRPMALDRVVADIDAQLSAGLRDVFFLDYVFGITPSFYGPLCERLVGRGMNWTCQTRAEIVLRSDVTAWYEAGCRGAWLGAESPTVSGAGVHKRVSQEQTERALAKLADAGITPFAFILIGLPGDKASSTGELVDWVTGLPAWFAADQLHLRPGTSLYDEHATVNPGGPPRTWEQVREMTRAYRHDYPTDLDAQMEALQALPNFVGNALAEPMGVAG